MNKISNQEIAQYLQEQYDYICSMYNSNQIIGLFTYGMVNYHFARTLQDIESVVLYLPSFEEMCLHIPKIIYIEDPIHNTKIRFTDIRLLYDLAMVQDTVVMESTFSEYKILNPKYLDIFNKYIYINKEKIFRYNEASRVQNGVDKALDLINEIQTTFHLSNNTSKKYFLLCRVKIACELFLSGTPIEDCIYIKKDYLCNYLQQVLDGNIIPDLDEIENDLYQYAERSKDLKINIESEDVIKKCILDMAQLGVSAAAMGDDFTDNLTEVEKIALKYIISKLDKLGCGNVSISVAVEESKISRPVFKNVLRKMDSYHVASITNQGVKGMNINLIDMSLLNVIDNL